MCEIDNNSLWQVIDSNHQMRIQNAIKRICDLKSKFFRSDEDKEMKKSKID